MKAGIIGGGKVGCCLAQYFQQAGVLQGITAAHAEKSMLLAKRFGTELLTNEKLVQQADILLLTVPDRLIQQVAQQLAAAVAETLRGKIFLHCSGSLGTEVLEPLKEQGAFIGSCHPLQSFVSAATELRGVYMAVDGDAEALEAAKKIAALLGGIPFHVPAKERRLYHAAACFCSNYVVAAAAIGQQLMARWVGSEDAAWQALLPLFKGTAANLQQAASAGSALTGPIARGDCATVSGHLTVLPQEVISAYCSLGLEAVRLASANGTIDSETAQQLVRLLEHPEVEKHDS